MSRRPSSSLTDGELRIMRALWDLGRATGTEIIERMQATDGRAFTFEPLVDRQVARKSALSNLLTKFFDGSPTLLVLDLFGHDALDAAELSRLRDVIDNGVAPPAARRRRKR